MSTANATQDRSEMNVLFVHSAIDEYPLTPDEFRVYAKEFISQHVSIALEAL